MTKTKGGGRLGLTFALAAAILLATSYAQAGPVSALEKSIIAKAVAGRTLTNAERVALERLWREADTKALAGIEREFANSLNASRLRVAKGTSAEFLDKNEFDALLARVSPGTPAEQRAQVMGFYQEGRVYVNRAYADQLPVITAHERVHAVSSPLFRDTFGRDLNEGFTEMYARRVSVDPQFNSIVRIQYDKKTATYLIKQYQASTYQAERDLATMLTARVGPGPVERAYFSGDVTVLRQELDSQLGSGTYYRFSTATRTGNYEYARELLRGGRSVN